MKFMRSFVALVFAGWMLIGSFLPGIGIDQSAHLGDLVQHYQQHRKTDANLSFLAFINMHYGANSDHQKHPKHSHENLPVVGHSAPVYAPNVVRLLAPAPVHVLIVSAANFFQRVDMYSFLGVFALINPPRA